MMPLWAYSVHWREEVVTVTISIEATSDTEALRLGRRRLEALFPYRAGKFANDMVEDVTAKMRARTA